MKSTIILGVVLTLSFVGALVLASADDDVVVDPKSGQRVLVNQLAILGEGQDVPAIVAEYGGTITIAVRETDTYQARFPVRSLKQLDAIAKKLQKRGLRTQYVFVTRVSHGESLAAQKNLTTATPVGYKARAMFSIVRHHGHWHHHHHTGGGPAIVLTALNQV